MSFDDLADRVARRNKPQPTSIRGAIREAIVPSTYVPPAPRSNVMGHVLLYLGMLLTIASITFFLVLAPEGVMKLGILVVAACIAIAAKGARILHENRSDS